jgi:ribosomal protein S18 acetylase RimI-like enzyme
MGVFEDLEAERLEVEVLRDVTDQDAAAINRLLAQLSRSAPPLDAEAVRRVATWKGNSLLAVRAGGEIIGILTLVTFLIPTGLRAWIEDVVVDESARGQGVGAALTLEAIRLARAAGVRTIDLTTRPSREAAGRLYERLGFQLRDSRVYRLADLTGDEGRVTGGGRQARTPGPGRRRRIRGRARAARRGTGGPGPPGRGRIRAGRASACG